MMEKAIKQRLLGGLVLVAGAALFLPVLLDGSGAGLTIPPMPKAPEVGGVEALAPRLDQKVAETEKAVDAAHAGRDEAAAGNAAPAGEGAGDVAPDAAALAASEDGAATAAATVTAQAAKPAAVTTPGSVTAAPLAKAPVAATANAKPAATALPPARPTATVAVAPPSLATPVAPAKPASATAAVPPRPAAVPAPAMAKPATPAATKPAEAADAAKAAAGKSLPGAWLVQVGVFSSRDKAQALVQQLRRKGYAAVLNPQGGSFKVVVGPELNRSVADSIKARLAADPELRLNGWVQAYKP